ncbi:MAG: invasion associated locus B family protein [Pseudomonadota bacterium]
MGRSSFLKGLMVLSFFALGATEASAQRVAPPGPTPPAAGPGGIQAPQAQIVAKHGAWQVQCTDIPVGPPPQQPPAAANAGGDSGKSDKAAEPAAAPAAQQTVKQCGMLQSAQASDRKGISMTLVMGTAKQDKKVITMMRILVPIGVYLPLGIALEIDGAPVGRVPFTRCLPQICTAVAEASAETLGKMRKGAKANFIIYEQPGVGINLPVSLQGFTAAHKKLLSL